MNKKCANVLGSEDKIIPCLPLTEINKTKKNYLLSLTMNGSAYGNWKMRKYIIDKKKKKKSAVLACGLIINYEQMKSTIESLCEGNCEWKEFEERRL